MALVVTIEPLGFKEAEKKLAHIKNGAPRAISEAVNRGLTAGRTFAVKEIRGRYNVSAAGIKAEGMYIKRASFTALGGVLGAKGPMLRVDLFSPSERASGKYKGVSVMIIRGNRKILMGGAGRSPAFMIPSGRVMERRQPSRYPIFPVSTIGVPYMFGKLEIFESTQKKIEETTEKRLAHNIESMLGGSWK